jgi:hypothetical protein
MQPQTFTTHKLISFALETQTGKTSFEWGSIFSLWYSLVIVCFLVFLSWPKKDPLQMRVIEEIWTVGGRGKPTDVTLHFRSSTFSSINF